MGTDQFGNEISEVHFDWDVEAGGGTIDADGTFKAGMELGVYSEAVKVNASSGDASVGGTAGVIVRPTKLVGAVGGPALAVTAGMVDGTAYVFHGSGNWVVAEDVSDPADPVEVSRLALPDSPARPFPPGER